jgi:chromate reductase
MPVLPGEAYIGAAHELFDEQGKLKNESTRAFLANIASSFAAWIETQAGAHAKRAAA